MSLYIKDRSDVIPSVNIKGLSNVTVRAQPTQMLLYAHSKSNVFIYSSNQTLLTHRGTTSCLTHVSDWYKTIISLSGGWDNWLATGNALPDELDSVDHKDHLLNGVVCPRHETLLHIDPVTRVAGYINGTYKLLIGEQSNSKACSSSKFYAFDINALDLEHVMLFDIINDPYEQTDISEDNGEIVGDMVDAVISYLSHITPLQCQLDSVDDSYPSDDVPYFLPWDYSYLY